MEETATTSLRSRTNARLTCHAWEISGKLRKLANRFPQSRDNILNYSERLEVMSRNLLSLFPILDSLPKRDLIIAQHHLGTCHNFINTFHGLQELLVVCASNSRLRPVILLSEKRLNILSEDTLLHFQQALSNMEASIGRAIYSMRESFKYNGALCSDLEALFEWVAAKLQSSSIYLKPQETSSPQDCLTFVYEEPAMPTDASSPEKESNVLSTRTIMTDLPGICALHVKPVTALHSSSVVDCFPDLGSLSWIDNNGEQGFLIPPSQLYDGDDMNQQVSFFETLLEHESGYQASFAESLIDYTWDQESQISAGRLVLHDTLLTSYNHGRMKEREVVLFQNRLLFLRNKGDFKMVIWDISLWQNVILIAYNPKAILRRADKDFESLTVYWKTEVAGEPRVSGVEIYFEEWSSLELWAAFLALDPKKPEPANTSNDFTISVDISETLLAPEDTLTQDLVSRSRQHIKISRNGVIKSVWSAISSTKNRRRKQREQT